MPVYIRNQVRAMRLDVSRLTKLAQRILGEVGEPSSELGLTIVGDRLMRRLNREYRKKDRTTDVLAFAMREASGPQPHDAVPLGDVVISAPTALRQAREKGHSLDREVTILLVHGILHLCGYDHERSESEARRMLRQERTILSRVGTVSGLPRVSRRVGGLRSTKPRERRAV